MALVLREISVTHRRNPGGYLWAILEPLGAILLMTLAFSLFIHNPPLGTSFLLFYATGFLPFVFHQRILQRVQRSLRFSMGLMLFPRVAWIDVVLSRLALATLTQGLVLALVLGGMLWWEDHPPEITVPPILLALTILALTAWGAGMANAAIGGLFPIWLTIWSIINRPLLLLSGVFFLFESLPQSVQAVLWWLPMLQAISLMRSGIYPTYDASFVSPIYCLLLGLTLVAGGLVLLQRFHQTLQER